MGAEVGHLLRRQLEPADDERRLVQAHVGGLEVFEGARGEEARGWDDLPRRGRAAPLKVHRRDAGREVVLDLEVEELSGREGHRARVLLRVEDHLAVDQDTEGIAAGLVEGIGLVVRSAQPAVPVALGVDGEERKRWEGPEARHRCAKRAAEQRVDQGEAER